MARHCTDLLCLVIFLACVVGLTWILNYARENGDYRRLFHGYNYIGQLCGVDVPEEYLYYCQDSFTAGVLDLTKPICVEACPPNNMAVIACADGSSPGYPTTTVADRFCVPTSGAMVDQVNGAISANKFYNFSLKLSQLPQAWAALAISAVLAVVLGYVYLYTLEKLAGPMVCVCLIVLVAIPLLLGGYLIWVAKFQGGFDGIPDVGNDEYNFYAGCGCVGIGLVLACVCLCSVRSMEAAIGCIKAACECIFAEPTMLLAPLIEIGSKAVVLGLMLAGFLLLVSCGSVSSTGGVYRTFTYSDIQYAYLAYYIFMMLWVCELFTAMSQFVVAYAAQLWYNAPYEGGSKKNVPSFGIFQGYLLAGTFHLGSLLFGSFLIALLRGVRMILGWIAQRSKESGNVVAECAAKVCICVVSCFQRVLEFLNKMAYIEIAMTGSNFCTAAMDALSTMAKEAAAIGILQGATFILQIVGVGCIVCGGGVLTWLLCLNLSAFNDASSDHHVSDPVFVAGAAAVICGIIAVAFMVVFDTVSDTMLLCFAKDSQNPKGDGEQSSALAATSAEGGVFSSFLGCGRKPMTAPSTTRPDHTPPELRKLIAEHRG